MTLVNLDQAITLELDKLLGDEAVEKVARALMDVRAAMPGNALNGLEVPVLDLDPDYDDLPRDKSEGTEEDPITQEAVLKLAKSSIDSLRPIIEEAMRRAYSLGESKEVLGRFVGEPALTGLGKEGGE